MYINAIGHYVPSGRVANEYFENLNGLEPGWILQRTGISTRSKAAADENVDTMAIDAIENALPKLPYDIKEVDLIVASFYSAYDTVATPAHVAQRHYGIHGAKAVYASSACSSFINGLEIIEGYFASGKATKALLICSEHNTYYSNDKDHKAGHLWGDGAVAYFVSKERQSENDLKILDIFTEGLGDIGKGPDGVKLRPGEDGISMPDGRDVFIHACKYMIYALRHSLENTGLKIEDINKLITHQANKRIVAQVAHQLDKPLDDFLNNIETLGNTGSASCALVLAQNLDKFKKGDKVALMVFGGGYSCGCFIVEF
ncbi:MAG: ketoacyl-ACP synthase III [Bacteroides sp.]|nr:ketoacyl-ACP synthase III [Bacteroides sp.]